MDLALFGLLLFFPPLQFGRSLHLAELYITDFSNDIFRSVGHPTEGGRTWIESGFFHQTRFVYVHNDGNKLLFESKSSRLSLESIFSRSSTLPGQ